jgi:hypothetical protein
MQADPEQESYLERCVQCQKTAVDMLERYRTELHLREYYNRSGAGFLERGETG